MRKKLSFVLLTVAALLVALAVGTVFGQGENGLEKAKQAQEAHTNALLAKDGVEGTAVGYDADGQPVVVIYTSRAGVPGLPDQLDGVPAVVRVTGKFYALTTSVAPPPLTAKFTWSCSGLTCDFDASSTTGKGKKTYSWDFGDNNSGSGVTISHTYGADGKYAVTLTASSDGEPDSQATDDVSVSAGSGPVSTNCYAGGSATTTERCERPVPIGVSIGHPDITAGTIGMRYVKGNDYYILSNNHVLANMNAANIGDSALQPGTYDGGVDPADSIATLSDYEPIDFSGGDNYMDAAIAVSSSENLGDTTPVDGYGMPSSNPVPAALNMSVQKYGRTTGLTTGTVTELNVIVNVCYEGFPFCTKSAKFVDQIGISDGSFSAGGDSGSSIVTMNNELVGLLFAGSDTRTLANPMGPVLARFDSGGSPPPPSTDNLVVTFTSPAEGETYFNRDNVYITAHVTDGTGPVAGAVVSIKITTPKSILTCSPTSGTDGYAECRHKVNSNRDGIGKYSVDATASKSGYGPGTKTTFFMVE